MTVVIEAIAVALNGLYRAHVGRVLHYLKLP